MIEKELEERKKNIAKKMLIGLAAANKHGKEMMIDCGNAQSSAFAIASLICDLAFASEQPLEKVIDAVGAAAKIVNQFYTDTGVYSGDERAAH